jgi:hypothetical protein
VSVSLLGKIVFSAPPSPELGEQGQPKWYCENLGATQLWAN